MRKASPGTSVLLKCDLGLDLAEGQVELAWSQKLRSSEEERLVTSLKMDLGQDQPGKIISHLAGFTSLLLVETSLDTWRHSWRLIIDDVGEGESGAYQCKVKVVCQYCSIWQKFI